MCAWYRKNIRSFAKRTAPLRALTKPGVPFEWTEEHENIFRSINEELISPPILRVLDNSKTVYILVDASTSGTSWTIAQKDGNRMYPCYYGGQSVSPAQSRWNAYELEIFSLVQCLQTHYSSLIGRDIIVLTDCASLNNFSNLHLGSNRLRRWAYLFSFFNLSIRHVPGHRNVLPDAISRQFDDLSPEERLQFTPNERDNSDDYILRITASSTISRPAADSADVNLDNPDDIIQRESDEQHVTNFDWNSNTSTVVTKFNATPFDLTNDASNSVMTSTTDVTTHQQLSANAAEFTPASDITDDVTVRAVTTRQRDHVTADIIEQQQIQPIDFHSDTSADYSQSSHDASEPGLMQDTNSDTIPPPMSQISSDDDDQQLSQQHDTIIHMEPDIRITIDDYLSDPEFKDITRYKLTGELTGNDTIDRKILFTSDSYHILDGRLYRVTEARTKRQQNIRPISTRLCIVKRLQLPVVTQYHHLLNHAGTDNLLATLKCKIYFENLNMPVSYTHLTLPTIYSV